MRYDLARTIDAAVEPVTVDQAKAHGRIETDDDDDLIATYITAARQYCEKVTGRAFLLQTWRLSLERFPSFSWLRHIGATGLCDGWGYLGGALPLWHTPEILLPRPKIIGIASVTYLDLNGARQTLDPSQYQVDFDAEPARLMPAIGCYWPFSFFQRGSVQVTYTAGYGSDPTDVPVTLQLAILQLVAHWYENRESTVLPQSGTGILGVPMTVSELLDAETFTAFTLES